MMLNHAKNALDVDLTPLGEGSWRGRPNLRPAWLALNIHGKEILKYRMLATASSTHQNAANTD